MKFGANVLHINTHQLTSHFQTGGHDVISCRKVLPAGESTQTSSGAYAAASTVHTCYLYKMLNCYVRTINTIKLIIPFMLSVDILLVAAGK